MTLTDNDEAATVVIKDDKSTQPVFDFVREDGQTKDQVQRAAKELKKILALRSLRLPANAVKRATFEHLQALA
ncbi:MAG: hypothetical protein ACU0A8_05670 [Limimaricola soesokkakensis]|uniref:hypothetical protein n=1 Tax=Limimaricola soesokkakensis TaxID=1343159 RepID=UPI004059C4DB